MREPVVTIVGNLAANPELRFLPSGVAVANFTVGSTPRVKDGDDWKDGETMWVRCTVWREYAENVAESLSQGVRVVVTGALSIRTYEVEGQKRTALEMQVEEVGPSLRFATATVNRAQRQGAQQQGAQQQVDPWATPAQPQAQPTQQPVPPTQQQWPTQPQQQPTQQPPYPTQQPPAQSWPQQQQPWANPPAGDRPPF